MALTAKKRKFADAVLAGKSNKDAAIAAGYSPATASAAGSRLVKDKDVALYLAANRVQKESSAAARAQQAAPPQKPAGFDLGAMTNFTDPKAFLIAAMNDARTEPKLRIDAAKALMPFVHKRLGEGGKKEQRDEAAKKAASRFAQAAPPRLVANGGKKVE
ncbi:terminase small subunit [Burkholderia multivorans]|uniref:terminase small subunit n=1 Tax=Burkholderia multivorans TaxID=87883 RepID=UPI000CFFCE41|nr:terminase small subunit [Burkholderia multivorans]MBU9461357.1 terminase small subunit [Burkholderia multivorans]MCL4664480.1 terminase small subunit [Burkholderia multivorans]MCO1355874.1 terminase small subunit [Burkholderia multivorans]MCO1358835.1 terminase small subunit [Burkholderia multivorans]MCO1415942.1 terminase small subunit [Burkholderia multivorans]